MNWPLAALSLVGLIALGVGAELYERRCEREARAAELEQLKREVRRQP